MNKIAIVFVFSLFILAPTLALAFSYERNPASFSFSNPLIISLNFDNWAETLCPFWANFWTASVCAGGICPPDDPRNDGTWLSSSTLSADFVFDNLPAGFYNAVILNCSETGEGSGLGGNLYLEGDENFDIFEIIESPKILTTPTDAAGNILSFAGRLFSDLWELIALTLGIPIGFYIISRAIKAGKNNA